MPPHDAAREPKWSPSPRNARLRAPARTSIHRDADPAVYEWPAAEALTATTTPDSRAQHRKLMLPAHVDLQLSHSTALGSLRSPGAPAAASSLRSVAAAGTAGRLRPARVRLRFARPLALVLRRSGVPLRVTPPLLRAPLKRVALRGLRPHPPKPRLRSPPVVKCVVQRRAVLVRFKPRRARKKRALLLAETLGAFRSLRAALPRPPSFRRAWPAPGGFFGTGAGSNNKRVSHVASAWLCLRARAAARTPRFYLATRVCLRAPAQRKSAASGGCGSAAAARLFPARWLASPALVRSRLAWPVPVRGVRPAACARPRNREI